MMPTEVVGSGGRAEGGGIHDEFSQSMTDLLSITAGCVDDVCHTEGISKHFLLYE